MTLPSVPCAQCGAAVNIGLEKCPRCDGMFAHAPCPQCGRPVKRLFQLADEMCEACVADEHRDQDEQWTRRDAQASKSAVLVQLAVILTGLGLLAYHYGWLRPLWKWVRYYI